MDCENIFDDSTILQGDIFYHSTSKTTPKEILVILSADCDIFNEKYGKNGLTCLEVTPLNTYIRTEFCYNKTLSQLKKKENKAYSEINTRWLSISGHEKLSESSVSHWIDSASSEEILNALPPSPPKDDLKNIIDAIKKTRFALSKNNTDDITLLSLIENTPIKNNAEKNNFIIKQLKEFKKNVPLDSFIITSLPNISDSEDIAYVIKLRNLKFIPRSLFFTSLSSAKSSSEAYVRFARLTPTFKHALSQQFGNLYARIGLPSQYEVNRETAFDLLIEQIV
ncbi:hypothetical protein [Aeromonas dhakensis]|uniref:hypothetical protein n=1 Tax=Aeromonas dhakensis TaxID=196024 RepID=UPI0038D10D1E